MRSGLLAFLICAIAGVALAQPAHASNKVKLGVLKFGTVSWAARHHPGQRPRQGRRHRARHRAAGKHPGHHRRPAERLGRHHRHGLAVGIARAQQRRDFTFSPFTTALGAIMVPPNSPIKTLGDLKGKRLGVAGGPLDKSWLLLVAYALRTANLDLRTDTKQEYGAPPLLAERAKQGEIDAVLNFWPYAARLEAEGFTQLIGVEDVVRELGAKGEVAMVGYIFSEGWAKKNSEAIQGFLRAAAKADELLATSDAGVGSAEAADGRERSQLQRRDLRGVASPLSRGHSRALVRRERSPTPRSCISSCASSAARSWSDPAPSLRPARSGTAANHERDFCPQRRRCRRTRILSRPDRLGALGRGLPARSGSSPPRSRRAGFCRDRSPCSNISTRRPCMATC